MVLRLELALEWGRVEMSAFVSQMGQLGFDW